MADLVIRPGDCFLPVLARVLQTDRTMGYRQTELWDTDRYTRGALSWRLAHMILEAKKFLDTLCEHWKTQEGGNKTSIQIPVLRTRGP
jgi:hypothetical protein